MASNPINFNEFFDPLGPGSQELLEFAKAIDGLSKSHKALTKNLEGNGQKVAQALGALTTQTTALRTAMAGASGSTDQERASYADLRAQLQQLFQEQQRLLASQAGIDNTRKNTTQAVRILTTELGKQQQALKDAYAAGNTEGIRTAAAEILRLKANSEDLNRALRGANSSYTATAGSYRAMENEARQLGVQLKALDTGLGGNAAEAQALQTRLAEVNAKLLAFDRTVNDGHRNVGRYAESIQQAVGSLEKQRTALLADANALRTQAGAAGLSSEQQDKLQAELQQTDAQLAKVNGELRAYGVGVQQGAGATSQLSAGAGELAQSLLGSYYGIQGIVTALQQGFAANVQYSRELAEVRKTTGLTADEAERLADELKALDTPTSLSGLLKIASTGGQLGYAKTELLDFTKAVDVAVQALGNDFGEGADAAEMIATTLGRIGSVYRKEFGTDTAQNILAIGSAVNELGAVGSATAPFLTDYATRVGAIASAAGVGLKNVLAYGAVLQEQGYQAEVAATATNRLFSTLSTKTKEAYEIAKLANPALTLKEYARLVNTDFNQAVQVFLRGLNEGGKTTTAQARLLGTLKLQSGEAKNAIVTLAKNTGLFAERQATANTQLREATSLQKEASVMTETLGGSWDKLKNDVGNFFTSGVAGKVIKFFVDYTRAVPVRLLVAGFRGIADGITYLGERAGLVDKPLENLAYKQAKATQASYKQIAAQQALLKSYTDLAAVSQRSGQQENEYSQLRLRLQEQFGTTDAQAAAEQLARRQEQTDANKAELQRNLDLYTQSEEEVARRVAKLRDDFAATPKNAAGIASTFSGQKLAEDLAVSERALAEAQRQRAQYAAAVALFQGKANTSTKDGNKLDDESIGLDKKKKQSVADVAKEEYQLQKQRLEARIADLDRQADNGANSSDLRTRASGQATAARIELARRERDELIREAAQANKDKIGGDQATAVARQRLQEAFNNQTVEIARSGDKKLLALRNLLADQLAQVDRAALEHDVSVAEKVRDDVSKTYDERQAAARAAAHAQIELARLTRDAEVRAAQGALDKIEAAELRFQQAREKASQSVKVYDSQKDLDEQDARYARLLLATEDLHDKQLTSEKTYLAEVRDLENQHEREAIAALEAEYGETAEVLRRKAALRRKERQEQTEEERAAAQERQQLIQQGFATTQAIADAFFQHSADLRAADLEDSQRQYENDVKVAGDNTALKEKAEQDRQKREAKIRHQAAVTEREQALFSIALNTAQAVMSVLSTGGGAHYLDFGTSAGILSALVTATGIAQAAAVLAKPLPAYFVGRQGGPAEFATLAERGPELVGRPGSYRLIEKPTVGFLRAGEDVIPAPRTQDILREGELVAGRIQYRQEQADIVRQTGRLQLRHTQWDAQQQRLWEAGNDRLLSKLEHVRREIEEQGYRRWDELGQAIKEIKKGMTVQRMYDSRRYSSDWDNLFK